MKRRNFLRAAVVGAGVTAFGNRIAADALADPRRMVDGPYGPLQPPDANGIALPSGFTSRLVGHSGDEVEGTGYTWHGAPDGGAVFADGDGWIYVSNSEVQPDGGAGAVVFDADGNITGAHRVLEGTRLNCAGGKTPWNTWLSCEEVDDGYVYECLPAGPASAAVRHPAMGQFKHEAAAADPVRKVVYMTEDVGDGCFYRFVPDVWEDMSAGTLEVLVAGEETSGEFTWAKIEDPTGGSDATRYQVEGAKHFEGGEGLHYANDTAWFTTKGDNRIWRLDLVAGAYALAYDDTSPLSGVDNITGSAIGDLYIAEDGGDMQICMITADGTVSPFLQVTGQDDSELCGPAFSPAGDRLYFSSQRGAAGDVDDGMTYEITGPFRA